MRVLVTGATGCVGSAVVRALLDQGHDVIALVRDASRGRWLQSTRIELAVGDLRHPESYVSRVSDVDAVIHAAHEKLRGRWTRRRIAAVKHTDRIATRAIASACLAQGKRLIYTSGAMAHASHGDAWIDERTKLNPVLAAKGHAEMVEELTQAHRKEGLDAVIVTPGFVYGNGGLLSEMVTLLHNRQYRIIDSGDNFWSFVHADDLGAGYVLALERGRAGSNYFFSDGTPLRRREAIDLITDELALDRVGHVPGWLVGMLYGFPMVEAVNASIRMRNDRATRVELASAASVVCGEPGVDHRSCGFRYGDRVRGN